MLFGTTIRVIIRFVNPVIEIDDRIDVPEHRHLLFIFHQDVIDAVFLNPVDAVTAPGTAVSYHRATDAGSNIPKGHGAQLN